MPAIMERERRLKYILHSFDGEQSPHSLIKIPSLIECTEELGMF